ncbi:MAG: transglycosylase SLT domain-containing protein, partial [Nitrospiraceae bacterium]|nr:transglycosylase SLT domain-containing protein [Nitrospiraceae bacterium]
MQNNRHSLPVTCVLCLAAVAVLLGTAASAAGPKASLPPEFNTDRLHKHVTPYNVERRSAAAERREKNNLRQFVDSNGVLTITNRPDKYRRKRGYLDVTVKFDPINVAPRYRAFKSAAQYSSKDVSELVRHYARRYALDANLVFAVIQAESNFNPHAVSPAGARGLMQLMPGTAAEMGVTDIFDPAQNIAAGTQYLAKMHNLFSNNRALALAAYNAGPNAVKKHGGIPPYPETRLYVRKVLSLAGRASGRLAAPKYKVAAAKPSAKSLPEADGQRYT